jgi:hypothetical protein
MGLSHDSYVGCKCSMVRLSKGRKKLLMIVENSLLLRGFQLNSNFSRVIAKIFLVHDATLLKTSLHRCYPMPCSVCSIGYSISPMIRYYWQSTEEFMYVICKSSQYPLMNFSEGRQSPPEHCNVFLDGCLLNNLLEGCLSPQKYFPACCPP